MLRKPWKTIQTGTGEIAIYGNNHDIEIDYDHTPEWSEDPEPSFLYKGNRLFLSEFVRAPANWPEFNGMQNDSFFSGTLIKLTHDGESVRAYTFICLG